MKTMESKQEELAQKHQKKTTESKNSIDKLKKTFEIIKNEFNKDCAVIDNFNIQSEISKLSLSRAKWINRMGDFIIKKDKIWQSMRIIRRDLYEFYIKDYDLRLDKKEELNLFIETDESYQYILTLYKHVESIINYCEYAVKNLNSRQWEIKAYQSEREWSEGGR